MLRAAAEAAWRVHDTGLAERWGVDPDRHLAPLVAAVRHHLESGATR